MGQKRVILYSMAFLLAAHSGIFAQAAIAPVSDSENITTIKLDGPEIPQDVSLFEFDIGSTHKKVYHWRTGAIYTDRNTGYYWAAFANNKTGIAIGELTAEAGFQVLGIGRSNNVVFYHLKIKGLLNSTMSILTLHPRFINLMAVQPEEKLSIIVKEWYDGKGNLLYNKDSTRINVRVRFGSEIGPDEQQSILKNNAYEPISMFNLTGATGPGPLIAGVTKEQLIMFAGLEEVEGIEEYFVPKFVNDAARVQTRVSNLQNTVIDTTTYPPSVSWNAGRQYMGDSVWVGIYDVGIDSTHPDFREGGLLRKATIPGVTYWYRTSDIHGTHVAGIAMGNGQQSQLSMPYGTYGWRYQWRGVAPKAKVWSFSQIYDGIDADVNNHSFFVSGAGYYGIDDESADDVVADHDPAAQGRNNVSVFAVANNGAGPRDGYLQQGYYSILVNAKNPIKVGATEKYTGLIADFSSKGPTRDGRIGPDVMAPGSGGKPEYKLEFDSIAIKGTSGIKKTWQFDNTGDMWQSTGCTRFIGISNSVLSANVTTGSEIQCPYISPSGLITDATDTLIFFWRTTKITTSVPTDSLGISVKGIHTNGVLPWLGVSFAIKPPASWQPVKLCLGDLPRLGGTSNGQDIFQRWTKDTIYYMNFQFGTASGPGTGVTSCLMDTLGNSTFTYLPLEGTSMAAPHVTGIVALMLQKLRDAYGRNIHDNPFWNSTAKAILIHTATDMVQTSAITSQWNNPDFDTGDGANGDTLTTVYGPGPDFATGYGLVNAEKAVQYVDTNRYKEGQINQMWTKCFFITVPGSTAALRSTLAWDDPGISQPLNPYDNVLVNNLDLKMVNMANGQISYPWVYDHSRFHDDLIPANGIDSLMIRDTLKNHPATKGIDTVNNVEVVDVTNPQAGQWMVAVTATDITADQNPRVSGTNQDFSLVSDFTLMPDTGQAGIVARYKGTKNIMKNTVSGDMRLRGMSSITGNYQGFLFKCTGAACESLDTNGFVHCTNVPLNGNQGIWLNVPSNLIGGLVWRGPDGEVKVHYSSGSVIHVRGAMLYGTVN